MIDATAGMVEGCDCAACKADIKLRLAFERCVEIVSEASRHVPEAEKALQPEIPWREIAVIGSDREAAAGGGPDLVPAPAWAPWARRRIASSPGPGPSRDQGSKKRDALLKR